MHVILGLLRESAIGSAIGNRRACSVAAVTRQIYLPSSKGVTEMRKHEKSGLRLSILFIAIFLISAFVSQAQEMSYRVEIFGGVTYPAAKDFEITAPQTPYPVPGRHSFSLGGRGGARLGKELGTHWGMDYDYSYGANASAISTQFGELPIYNHIHQVSANLLVYPFGSPNKRILPYLTSGIGATFVTVSQKTIGAAADPARGGIGQLSNDIMFAFNAGVGIRIRMSSRYGLRFDVRDYVSRPIRYGLPVSSSDPNAAVFPVSGIFHQPMGSIGFVVHF